MVELEGPGRQGRGAGTGASEQVGDRLADLRRGPDARCPAGEGDDDVAEHRGCHQGGGGEGIRVQADLRLVVAGLRGDRRDGGGGRAGQGGHDGEQPEPERSPDAP